MNTNDILPKLGKVCKRTIVGFIAKILTYQTQYIFLYIYERKKYIYIKENGRERERGRNVYVHIKRTWEPHDHT